MGFATHLGPWLLGTVKETTAAVTAANAANNLVRNTGATVVSQSFSINGAGNSTTAGAVLPAGAQIQAIQLYITTAFSGGTPALEFFLNSDSISNNPTITSAGVPSVGTGANGTKAASWANIGSVDKVLNATVSGTPTAGNAVVSVFYTVRNSDGTSVPANP